MLLSWHLHVATNTEALWNLEHLTLGIFLLSPALEGHDWLSCWLLVIEPNLQALSGFWRSGGEAESSNPLVTA